MKAKQLISHPSTEKFTLVKSYLVVIFYVNKTLNRSLVERKENNDLGYYKGNPNFFITCGDIVHARKSYRHYLKMKYLAPSQV